MCGRTFWWREGQPWLAQKSAVSRNARLRPTHETPVLPPPNQLVTRNSDPKQVASENLVHRLGKCLDLGRPLPDDRAFLYRLKIDQTVGDIIARANQLIGLIQRTLQLLSVHALCRTAADPGQAGIVRRGAPVAVSCGDRCAGKRCAAGTGSASGTLRFPEILRGPPNVCQGGQPSRQSSQQLAGSGIGDLPTETEVRSGCGEVGVRRTWCVTLR